MIRIAKVAGMVAVAALAFPQVTVGQGSTPEPCPAAWVPPDPSIVWDSGSVRLEADSIEMRRGDCFFSGVGPAQVSSDPGGPTYSTLEIIWEEQGARVGLNIYFAADETDWWITEIRTPIGEFQYQLAEMSRTPRGETLDGDFRITASDEPHADGLIFHGLRLTAFAPGTGPGPLVGCEPAKADPFAEGQPLHGTVVVGMSPTDAETLLRGLGLCFTFRYGYPTAEPTDGGQDGYSERWCTAPPTGLVNKVLNWDGELVVFVKDDTIRPERSQPPQGWNCPAN